KIHGARLVIFDIIFDEESGASQDAILREAIQRSGNVYLPFAFQFNRGDLPAGDDPFSGVRNILWPLKGFMDASKGYGHVNVAPDIDGTLRNSPLFIKHEGRFYPQLAFKAVCDYIGVDKDDIVVRPGRNILLKDTSIGDINIPIDSKNQSIVSWAGPWRDTFKHYSYIDIIVSHREMMEGKRPRVDLTGLKDKICIVGLTSSGLYDIRPIPLEPSYPVVGMNANIINNVLKKDFIKKAPKALDISLIYLMGILICMLLSKVRFVRGAFYMFAAAFGYMAASAAVFIFAGRWIAIVYPASSMFLAFLGMSLYNEVTLALERKKYFDLSIKDGLTKLFNIRHFKEILAREFALYAGQRKGGLSLIMTDVDYFKKFNDTYGHQVGDFVLKRVAKTLKDMSRSRDVVARYGGEEFIIMLPGTDLEVAGSIAERIRERIEKNPFKRSNETYSVTISLGVATLVDERTKEELIKKADDALYMAKQSGRNRVCTK
ncbi:MAG: diguanylate cyclase, partial [Candidatus Omnitrophica bacterium]|nr:diguanylate cyclase [Candidatus Omnitrophota bacterium]